MGVIKFYDEDLQIAKALIQRDGEVTRRFFYRQCYPLFKSIFDNYCTDCESCLEFINEIYVVVLAPSKLTGKCQMSNYKGESSLASWLKSACLFYCYGKYKQKGRLPMAGKSPNNQEGNDDAGDRILDNSNSCELDMSAINASDVNKILSLMRNERFRNIIRLLFLEGKSNEEVAEALNMTMANFYNKKKLAIEKFKEKLNEEDSI